MTDEFSPIGSPSRNGPHFMEIASQKCDVKCERLKKSFFERRESGHVYSNPSAKYFNSKSIR